MQKQTEDGITYPKKRRQNVKALNAAVQKMKDAGIVEADYKVKVYFSLYYPTGAPSGQSFGTYTSDATKETVSDISTVIRAFATTSASPEMGSAAISL